MKEQVFSLKNELGLHMKPAAMFVQEASKFKCSIKVSKEGEGTKINGKSIMGLLMLAAEYGSKLTIKADGPDEKEAVAALAKLFQDKFGED